MTISTGSPILASDVALGANMPSGSIIMWHGTIANIPAGWLICDGNNGTPNLLGRFVQGVATAATNPGTTGGATSKTTAGHTHTQPTHTHTVTPNSMPQNYTATAGYTPAEPTSATTSASGNDDTGSNTDTIADIRPLYYDIAFIMKS